MEQATTDPALWLNAAQRGADFLTKRFGPSGAIRELIGESRLSPRQAMARLGNLFDVWHTVSALLALEALGETVESAVRFTKSQVLDGGGLSHCSMRQGLCIESTAAAALIIPDLRPGLLGTLRRHALPGGRWASFILDRPHGYDLYMCGPSATGWALTALGGDDRLAEAARRYLQETCQPSGMWTAHPYACGTPFYPAHVAALWLPDSDLVVAYTLETVGPTGAWGFGDPPAQTSSVLPTALALLTLLACDPGLTRTHSTVFRAAKWLATAQLPNGSFPVEPIPPTIWYLGPVYVTTVAALALARLVKTAHRTP